MLRAAGEEQFVAARLKFPALRGPCCRAQLEPRCSTRIPLEVPTQTGLPPARPPACCARAVLQVVVRRD